MQDWGAASKFLLAPVLLTLAEKPMGFALDECTSILFRIPLVTSQSKADAACALGRAGSRTVVLLPEAACLIVAIAVSVTNAAGFIDGRGPSSSGTAISAAGVWSLAVSNTLYWFLDGMSSVARCRLRLVVTHPDGHGGLGFIGLYPVRSP